MKGYINHQLFSALGTFDSSGHGPKISLGLQRIFLRQEKPEGFLHVGLVRETRNFRSAKHTTGFPHGTSSEFRGYAKKAGKFG